MGLVVVAGIDQRHERERGVAHPAVAVVPVARAAQLLRQGGGGCRDHAAGRCVGECLQRDQRAPDGLGPFARFAAGGGPAGPEALGVGQCRRDLERRWRRQVRGRVGHGEVDGLAGRDLEFGHGVQVLTAKRHGGAQADPVGAGHGLQRAVGIATHPGDDGAVIEAEDQLHAHPHPPALAHDKADQVRGRASQRHEVDERDDTLVGLEAGLEDQGARAVTPGDSGRAHGCDQPASVLGAAQEGREAGAGIEAGPAEPVDRAVGPDQGRRLAVADQRVPFKVQGQGVTFLSHRARSISAALVESGRDVHSQGGAYDGTRE